MRSMTSGAADALLCRRTGRRMLISDQDVRLQASRTRQQVPRLARRVVIDVAHRKERQDLLCDLVNELTIRSRLQEFTVSEQVHPLPMRPEPRPVAGGLEHVHPD